MQMLDKMLNVLPGWTTGETSERADGSEYVLVVPGMTDLARSLERDVWGRCLPEGRKVGTAGHVVAEDFMRRRLKEVGCVPYKGRKFDLDYRSGRQNLKNLVGVVRGRKRSLPPLLIGAHYDSVIKAPCADDNGAAVAICLALAEILVGGEKLERDVIVAIFDAEEPPYFSSSSMGSETFYAEQLDDRGVHFAMIFDLVGHDVSVPTAALPKFGKLLKGVPGVGDFDLSLPVIGNAVFMTGAESHPSLPGMLDGTDVPSGLKLMATLNKYVGDMSDHGVFRCNDVPYLFFSCGRWAHYHQPTDTPDRLNYRKMARITHLAARLLLQADTEKFDSDAGTSDTLDYESDCLRSALGPLYPMALKLAGVPEIRTRAHMDDFVRALMATGL